MASEMPVLPLVGSSSSRPGSSSPEASAASIIAFATRSLIDPVGFWPSSFANTRTCPGAKRDSSTSGVFPTRSRRLGAIVLAATGHRRQQDDRGPVDTGLEPVERADVLAPEVHVHERCERPAVEELGLERGVPAGEVLEDL